MCRGRAQWIEMEVCSRQRDCEDPGRSDRRLHKHLAENHHERFVGFDQGSSQGDLVNFALS